MPRLSELQYGIKLVGPRVKLEQIQGSEVTVTAVGFFPSAFAPGAALQLDGENGPAWLLTYSQVVIETLEKHLTDLPYEAMFIQEESAAGRKFWTIV